MTDIENRLSELESSIKKLNETVKAMNVLCNEKDLLILNDFVEGRKAMKFLHSRFKTLAVIVTMATGAYFGLAEAINKIFKN